VECGQYADTKLGLKEIKTNSIDPGVSSLASSILKEKKYVPLDELGFVLCPNWVL
jgi:hypothetical protein